MNKQRVGLNSKTKNSSFVLFIPLLLLVTLISIAPSFDALVSSLNVGSVSYKIGLNNYRTLFRDKAIFYSLNISTLWALTNSVLSVLISTLLAHYLYLKKKRPFFNPFLLIPLAIPLYIAVPLWRAFIHGDAGVSLFSKLSGITMNLITDPVSAFMASLGVSIWLNVPMTTFVIRSYLDHVDKSLIDATLLETKGNYKIMKYVHFPVIKSSLLIMLALNFIKAFKEFTLIHLMSGGGVPLVKGITERYIVGSTTTLGVFIYNHMGTHNYPLTAAFSVFMGISVAIVLLFWLFAQIEDPIKRENLLTILVVFISFLNLVSPFRKFSFIALFVFLLLLFSVKIQSFRGKALLMQLFYSIVNLLFNGVLEGFSPLIAATLFLLVIRKKEYEFSVLSRSFEKLDAIKEIVYKVATCIFVALTILSGLLIVFYLIRLSLSPLNLCYFDSFLPKALSFESYKSLIKTEHIGRYFSNSFILAIGSALLTPLVVIPSAWYLSTVNKTKSNTVVSTIHSLSTMGGMHSLIPLFSIFLLLGLINSRLGLIFVYTVHAIPFSLVTIKNFFEDYSAEFREASLLEGASTIAYFRYVLVPLSLPIIKTSMLLAFLGAWNGFNAPLLFLSEESLYPISLKIYTYVGSIASGNPKWALFGAVSVVNLIIITLIGLLRFSKEERTTAV